MAIRHIYKGKIITLNIDTITLPNGVTVDLEIARHPGASFRHAAGGFFYEIPAGKLSPGEDPVACAARELEEEIGYRAVSFELLSSIFSAPGFTDEVIHIYRATGLTKGRQELDRDEVLEVVEMPLSEAITMIQGGTIRDAKTIVGLQMVYIGSEHR